MKTFRMTVAALAILTAILVLMPTAKTAGMHLANLDGDSATEAGQEALASPGFIRASEQGGELRFSGNGYDYYDYARALVTKGSFSGSFTLDIDLTSVSGSGTQWGAGVVVVKDDFTAIQLEQSVYRWSGWPADSYTFYWRARESCIDGTPECPTSPGGSGTPVIGEGQVKAPGLITLPIALRIVYDGNTEFRLRWDMSGEIYEYTHNAPEIYDNYRIVIYAAARLADDSVGATFDNLNLAGQLVDNFDDGVIDDSIWSVEVARPGYGIWKLAEPSSDGPAVGGVAELPDVTLAPASHSDSSDPPSAAIASGLAAAAAAFAASGWYARRLWRRR